MKKRVRLLLVSVLFSWSFPAVDAQVKEKDTDDIPPEVYPPHAVINAAYKGDVEMVKKILASGPDPDIRDALGGTALHNAMFQDNLEVIKLLLDYGFDINAAAASNGYTPLHYCVWANNIPAMKLLLAYQADRTIKAKNGLTPLDKAIKDGKRECILVLSQQPRKQQSGRNFSP
jgi:ankyrin repeat protein